MKIAIAAVSTAFLVAATPAHAAGKRCNLDGPVASPGQAMINATCYRLSKHANYEHPTDRWRLVIPESACTRTDKTTVLCKGFVYVNGATFKGVVRVRGYSRYPARLRTKLVSYTKQ
jgi:hypothetical protein